MGPTSVPPLVSKVARSSERFRQNVVVNTEAIARLEGALSESRQGGGERYNLRHIERGKLLPRERIERLRAKRDRQQLGLLGGWDLRDPGHQHDLRRQYPG